MLATYMVKNNQSQNNGESGRSLTVFQKWLVKMDFDWFVENENERLFHA